MSTTEEGPAVQYRRTVDDDIIRVDDVEDGPVESLIPRDERNADYQAFLEWEAAGGDAGPLPDPPPPDPAVAVEATLREQAESALEVNRRLAAQNAAIIEQAKSIEGYAPGAKTQAQVTADLVAGVKQLAAGIRILAEHDQQALVQRNGIIRLVVGALDDTD